MIQLITVLGYSIRLISFYAQDSAKEVPYDLKSSTLKQVYSLHYGF